MTERLDLYWKAPGPVADKFMHAPLKPLWTQILNGPIGSGKTTTIAIKAVQLAMLQEPSPRDGVRRFKLCAVGSTYRQIWRSLLPSWWKRFPRDEGFTGAENAPAVHRLRMRHPRDGSLIEFQADFIAIGENAAEDVMRGYEPTLFWMFEFDLLPWEAYLYAKGRAGRYPDAADGGATHYGILGDCNAPEFGVPAEREIFARSEAERAENAVELYVQPSGFSPQAENIPNLPGKAAYYTNQAKGQPEYYIGRMIENRPGYSRAGKPIYTEFDDARHVSREELDPIPGIPCRIGLDAGMSPAAAIGQRMANGQHRITDELVADQGTGPLRFGRMLAQLLHERYPHWRDVKAWADPSAAYGVDKKMGEASWIEIVSEAAGIPVDPAPTNSLIPRLEAVRKPLTMTIDREPALLLSPRCKILRQGFNSGYRFKRQVGHEDRYEEVPEKNEFSHPHDALQYLLSAAGEDIEIRGRKAEQFRAAQRPHEHDWDPFNLPR